jgi:hypothetical protein
MCCRTNAMFGRLPNCRALGCRRRTAPAAPGSIRVGLGPANPIMVIMIVTGTVAGRRGRGHSESLAALAAGHRPTVRRPRHSAAALTVTVRHDPVSDRKARRRAGPARDSGWLAGSRRVALAHWHSGWQARPGMPSRLTQ